MTVQQTRVKHLGYLDSLRGLAALCVVFYHFINWKYDHETGAKLASFVFNGSDAVSFFFVLSGYVLSYKFIVLKQDLPIAGFYVNRFFRLWPGFFVAVLMNALYWYRGDLNMPYLIDQFVYNKRQFWEEASLLRPHPYYFGASWTLVIELCLSLMIPFLVVIGQRSYKLLLWMVLMFFLIGNNMGSWIMYQVHFVLGVLLSCLYGFLTGEGYRQSKLYRYRYVLLAVAIILFSLRHVNRLIPFGRGYEYVAETYMGWDYFHYSGIASFLFLLLVTGSVKAQRVLNIPPLRWLGKISYGIYLMHWLIVTYVFDHWDMLAGYFPGFWPAFICLLLLTIIATFVLASLLHSFVEQPFIRLGHRLAKRIKAGYIIKSP